MAFRITGNAIYVDQATTPASPDAGTARCWFPTPSDGPIMNYNVASPVDVTQRDEQILIPLQPVNLRASELSIDLTNWRDFACYDFLFQFPVQLAGQHGYFYDHPYPHLNWGGCVHAMVAAALPSFAGYAAAASTVLVAMGGNQGNTLTREHHFMRFRIFNARDSNVDTICFYENYSPGRGSTNALLSGAEMSDVATVVDRVCFFSGTAQGFMGGHIGLWGRGILPS